MTIALYLEDSYLRECVSSIESVSGREVVLDRTVFYPRGGGQPGDAGKLVLMPSMDKEAPGQAMEAPGLGFRVKDTYKKDGKTIHELETEALDAAGGPMLKTGDSVRCVLDWERRYALMRMHTAAHVLGATMYDDLGARITGNQLEADKTRFDFDLEGFDRGRFDEAVAKANSLLAQDIALKAYSLPREEALRIPGVVKLAAALPPAISVLRIVEIPGVDIQADGGTHVRCLKEVGKIEIMKLENKGKSNRRIYFTLSPPIEEGVIS